MAGKPCSICKKQKPASEMRSNGHCKPCGKEYDAAVYARKKAAAGGGSTMKPEKKLSEIKVGNPIATAARDLTPFGILQRAAEALQVVEAIDAKLGEGWTRELAQRLGQAVP